MSISNPAATEIHLMRSKPYDVRRLKYYVAEYRHVEDSSNALLLQISDSASADGFMDAPKPYHVTLLHSILAIICTLAWKIPQNLKCDTASACTITAAALTKPAFSIPHYTWSTDAAALFADAPLRCFFRNFFNSDELN